ncbi:MAG TPA: hypothetical protein VKQ11_19625 [Candidatus Sulfotelmatobacter sp.]|nr:hypothetical protein [Candidatus Sulfotelmatobacter sp.]
MFDPDCNVQIALFPPRVEKQAHKPMEHYIDAFLYLGPQEFRLSEPMPADIALDADYMTELRRRASLMISPGLSKSQKELSDEVVQEAENPILEGAPKPADAKKLRQSCLDARKQGSRQ